MNYVKQVNPEYQESPLWLFCHPDNGEIVDHANYNGLILKPTDHCIGINDSDMTNLCTVVNEMLETYENIRSNGYDPYYKNMTECIRELTGRRPSTKTVHAWTELLKDWDEWNDDCLCNALSMYHGKNWDYQEIRGCCQGDYAVVFYNKALWNTDSIDCLEAEYFNTGSEWLVHDEDSEPETAEDINGYSIYIHGWNAEKALREEFGEDVVIYQWVGQTYVDKYEKIS